MNKIMFLRLLCGVIGSLIWVVISNLVSTLGDYCTSLLDVAPDVHAQLASCNLWSSVLMFKC